MPPRTRRFVPGPSTAEQHTEWLTLLRADGPFIGVQELTGAFPQGLDKPPADARARLRLAWAELQADPATLNHAWQHLVFDELLGYRGRALIEGAQLPAELASGAAFGRGLRPDALVMGPGDGGLAERMLVFRRPWGQALTHAGKDLPSAAEQAAELCRRRGVPLALLSNGRHWVLVHARPQEPTTIADFDADLWSEEPSLLRAFFSLLRVQRVADKPRDAEGRPSGSLAGLFARSAEATVQVTKTLGNQVRQAVQLLVGEVSRLDREAHGALLAEVEPRDVYRGALTVMMRLVFLLYAEEQRLLPTGDELYAGSYAVGNLYDKLVAEGANEVIGDRRTAAWPRLVAVFAAVYGGVRHPAMRLPAYGGSLFDPQRYLWLGGLRVTDRVVFTILDALVVLRHGRGRAAERLSYKGLDVEQIGHVYEGLLEYSCERVAEGFAGLGGKLEPEVALRELEKWRDAGRLEAEIQAVTGLAPKALQSALARQPDSADLARLRGSCDNDAELAARVEPFWGLLRNDLRGEPAVYPTDTVIVRRVGDRRDSGTHYTPRVLAEEIVVHTLDPLCYEPGPAEGAGVRLAATDPVPEGWRVRSADELLALKVLDPAMGSGAFLVSACRYLSERVVEAWERDGLPQDVAGYAVGGGFGDGANFERGDATGTADAEDARDGGAQRDEQLLAARRLVADRCLYGVDVDEMAVELAKLSLWLVTLAKGRPFSFVDHALRCGDSLIGCLTADQIEAFHLDPEQGRMINVRLAGTIDELTGPLLSQAAELRRQIEDHPVLDIRDAAAKASLLDQAEGLTGQLRLAADAVVAAALATAGQNAEAYDDRISAIAALVERALMGDVEAGAEARGLVDEWLKGPESGPRKAPIRPLHWPLEFPEVMADPGRGARRFDAVVGNPPFSGGTTIRGRLGKDYLSYIGAYIADGFTAGGRADLCSYFLLRDLELAPSRRIGIIGTNTIAQGDSREVGLDQAAQRNWTVNRAVKSQSWPNTAGVHVALLWHGRVGTAEQRVLDGQATHAITTQLDPQSRVDGKPHQLHANHNLSFEGCKPLGMGFVLEPDEAKRLIVADSRNAEVVFPYLNGEDLNSRPDLSASRWVIDYNDMLLESAQQYPDTFAIVDALVRPERQRTKPDGSFVLRRPLPQRWWQYADKRPAMRKAIAGLDRVIVIARISRTGQATLVSTRQVLNEKLVVFASMSLGLLALLVSEVHMSWAWKYSATLKSDLQYTPSDCFETFPQPTLTPRLDQAGEQLDTFRSKVMLDRALGLTKLYNEFHNRANQDPDIQQLRAIHREIDEAVAEAYQADPYAERFGWTPLNFAYDFYETPQGLRYTVAPTVRVEILDRLLELNHARYADEVSQRLHVKKGKVPASVLPRETLDEPPDGALF